MDIEKIKKGALGIAVGIAVITVIALGLYFFAGEPEVAVPEVTPTPSPTPVPIPVMPEKMIVIISEDNRTEIISMSPIQESDIEIGGEYKVEKVIRIEKIVVLRNAEGLFYTKVEEVSEKLGIGDTITLLNTNEIVKIVKIS